jgi:hypothetical protein
MVGIFVQVDPDLAKAFQESQPEQQQRIEAGINDYLRQVFKVNLLQNAMDQLSEEAQKNGLTPEILQSILEERLLLGQSLVPYISDEEQAEIEADLGKPSDYELDESVDVTSWVKYGGQFPEASD